MLTTIIRLREHHLRNHESVPSVRTMRRWAGDCRWLRQPEQTTQRHLELAG